MSEAIVKSIELRNAQEVEHIKTEIKRLGTKQENGDYSVTFGTLFKDDHVANFFEGLSATLKNAKQKKILNYDSPLLLQGAHDNVVITLFSAFVPE
jgi:hypothetical protein